MAVTDKNVNDLVISAFKLLGLYNEGRVPPSHRILEGIDILNEKVAQYEKESVLIPFNTTFSFTSTVGKSDYYISRDAGADVDYDKPCTISYLQLRYDNLLYPMVKIAENQYRKSFIAENTTGRPYLWFMQRGDTGSTLTIYPKPSLPYEIIIKGKFKMKNWVANDTFTDIDPAYYNFLKHEIARELHKYYPTGRWDALMEEDYNNLKSLFKSENDRDCSLNLGFDDVNVFNYKLVI